MSEGVRVTKLVTIPLDELEFTYSPSGGPGGQHANKASTRASLTWNLDESSSLSERQKERVRGALRHRIDSSGNLRLSSDRHRSQMRNREDVTERFAGLIADALKPRTPRVATRSTVAGREARLREKKRRSETKRLRGRVEPSD